MTDDSTMALFDEPQTAHSGAGVKEGVGGKKAEWALKSLRIEGFKSIGGFVLDTELGDVEVHADNRCGKTTIVDAFLWCMTGKDSRGRPPGQKEKEFRIKPLSEDGESSGDVETVVEAVFRSPGGQDRKFYRALREKWTAKRGTAEKTFDGNTTKYKVDGSDRTEAEYERAVAAVATGDPRLLACLINSRHFNEGIGWEDRREVLMGMLPTVTFDDVVSADPSLEALRPLLDGRTVEDYRKSQESDRAAIAKRIDELPGIIAEARRAVPDAPSGAVDPAPLRERRRALERDRALAESDGGATAAMQAVADARIALQEAVASDRRTADRAVEAASSTFRAASEAASAARSSAATAKADVDRAARILQDAEDLVEELLRRHADTSAQILPAVDVETECPTCGQAIPRDRIETAAKNRLDAFNLAKAESLAYIVDKGKSARTAADSAESALSAAKARLTDAEEAAKTAAAQESACKADLDAARARLSAIEPSEAAVAANRALVDAEKALEDAKGGNATATADVDAKIAAVDLEIEDAEKAAAMVAQRARAEARVEELMKEAKTAGKHHETAVMNVVLCDRFVRARIALLEEGVNSKTREVKFRLFRVQLNGVVVPCCETTLGGVPYTSLNTEGQVNAGIDVTNALGRHHGIVLPVFVDNGESVSEVTPSEGQQIRLYKVKGQRTLKVLPESRRGEWIG